jgi:ABC-type transporter Mla subunit MlaD
VAKRAKSTETIVGFFVLGAIALLLIVVITLGRQESIFQRRYEIIGAFDSVGGLQVGANVQLAGIVVGYVKDIRFGAQNRVEAGIDGGSLRGHHRRQSVSTRHPEQRHDPNL